jgi:hypothetical protein
MILLIGLFVGLICGLAGAKKAGFVSGWTTLLNASVAIYLGVYITPIVVGSVSIVGQQPYGPVLTALIASVALFVILSTITSAVTGDLKIAMPKLVETLGGGAIGFVSGMLLWGFVCLLLEISPLADSSVVKDTCRDPAEISQMWKGSVGTSITVLNAVTLQANAEPLPDMVEAMKAVAKPKEKEKASPAPSETPAAAEGETYPAPTSGG